MLMLHGTGAATHSFRDFAPLLAQEFHLLAPDLPGHGFTGMPSNAGLSLPGSARLMHELLKETGFEPEIAVGHSAGVAVLVEMALAGMIRPKLIVAINGALLPIRGASLFSPLARLLFLNPLAPKLFAWRAVSPSATRRLLEGTGSSIDARGVELYQRLFRKLGHVAGTLGMMANWDLDVLQRRIGRLSMPLVLISGANDKAVPPGDARIVAAKVPGARIMPLPTGGHLVHEEQSGRLAEIVIGLARAENVLAQMETKDLSKSSD